MTAWKKHIRILLVDREKDFLNRATKALKRCGYDVKSVQNGSVAARLLEDNIFDIAFLAKRMDGFSAHDLREEIRRRWPGTKVLELNCQGDRLRAGQPSSEQGCKTMTRPCTIDELEKAIWSTVSRGSKKTLTALEHAQFPA